MLPNHRLKRAAALTLAFGAIVPATATARPIGPDPAGASYTIPQTPVVRISTPARGFDWGAAGIGAAGGLALSMIAVGASTDLPKLPSVQQVTYAGLPLYRFHFDDGPEDEQGANVFDPVTSPTASGIG